MKTAPASRTRSRELYQEFKDRIGDGTYAPGDALPSTRACAAERGLSRTTVSAVYEQLAAEGFIESRPGSASRVAHGVAMPAPRNSARAKPMPAGAAPRLSRLGERLVRLSPPRVLVPPRDSIDFAYGPLAGQDFPTARWLKAARQVERERPSRMAYGDPRGDLAFRRALQVYLARARGIRCEVEQLVVANGSQQILDLCARLLVNPGDQVAVESPGYRMAHHAFEAAGARLRGVPVDAHGMRTDKLPRSATRFAYVTPTHQFPLGGFLPIARRLELLSWAACQRAWIIEDDYDAEYRHAIRPEETLKTLDRQDRVVYVGTFSKTLSPHLRLGYAVLPARLAAPFAQLKQFVDRHAPTAAQRTLAALLADGSYERHVRRMRRAQQVRRLALLDALERLLPGRVTVQGSASGLHVVVWVHGLPSAREPELIEAAREQRVWVHPLNPLYLAADPLHRREAGLIMGYALLSPDTILEGMKRLAGVIRKLGA